MNWLNQLRSRFRRRGVIVTNRRKPIGKCIVDLSGFPGDPLILDVDKLIKNDAFSQQIVYQYEQPCDLIVFYSKSGIPSVTLIEAKGTRNEAYGDEFKAVEQIQSSNTVLIRALNDCSIDLPELSITGAAVTGSLNSGALMRSDLKATVSAAEIDIAVVPSGYDVFDQLFGRY